MNTQEILNTAVKEYSKRSVNDHDTLVFSSDYAILDFLRSLIEQIEQDKIKDKSDYNTLAFLRKSKKELKLKLYGDIYWYLCLTFCTFML